MGEIIHETIRIPLKTISVDKGIINTVSFLNNFSNTYTLYSCEGILSENKQPYIIFISSQDDLFIIDYKISMILKNMENKSYKISIDTIDGILRYHMTLSHNELKHLEKEIML